MGSLLVKFQQTAFNCQQTMSTVNKRCQLSTNEIHVITACQLSTLLPLIFFYSSRIYYKKLRLLTLTIRNSKNLEGNH